MSPAFFAAAAVLAGSGAPPALPARDQAAIMRVLCEGELEQDSRGWVCSHPGTDDIGEPFQQRWLSAWRGRFVDHPGEWIVSLFRTCAGRYCPSDSHVVRKSGGEWIATRELDFDEGIGEDCLLLAGANGARDRLACLAAEGPYQGFMAERLEVLSFTGGDVTKTVLLAKEQGGECFLHPPLAELQADEIELLSAGDGGFTARLRVLRAPCDPKTEEGNGPIAVKAEHVLRFVRRGRDIVPDAASTEVIRLYDWMPVDR